MTTPAYALSDFNVNGTTIQARPTHWDGEDVDGVGNDIKGDPVYPDAWVTTCPFCGNMIEVKKEEVYISDDDVEFCIKCETCDSGKPQKRLQFSGETVAEPDAAAFIDPIDAGLFSMDHDKKLLKQLDKDLAKSL